MAIKDQLSAITSTLPDGVKLIAVSKFHPAESVQAAYDAGLRCFGESRVQELTAKQPRLPDDVEWHFIGSLQTNKVRLIAPFVAMIQSVDSLKLLREIDRQAEKCDRTIRVLIEVHIAGEDTKHGFSFAACRDLFCGDTLRQFAHIQVCGLMGMATFTDDAQQVRREFAALRRLFDEIRRTAPEGCRSVFRELSMGMSDDYRIAVEEGSSMIRIGTGIFGERQSGL
jgi:pyridoxal phosphate enzyme (YggS family)